MDESFSLRMAILHYLSYTVEEFGGTGCEVDGMTTIVPTISKYSIVQASIITTLMPYLESRVENCTADKWTKAKAQ